MEKNSLIVTNTSTQEHGYFRSYDGLKLFYSCRGPKKAPPLLFCYGLVCSKLQWKYQLEYFSKNYRVIYFDYRGHNNSQNPDDPSSMTIETMAKDLATLHDELKLGPVPVVGHSLGVNIILEFYRMYPQKVSALVLANGTPKDPFETMFGHNFLQVAFPLVPAIQKLAPSWLENFWKNQGNSILSQELVALLGFNRKYAKRADINEYLRLTSTVRADLFVQLLNDFTRYDACYWLDQVKVPTLIIGGAKDLITPPINAKKMAKLIPGSVLKIFKDGSHCVQMEQIEAVNSLLEDFFRNCERKRNKEKIVKERRAKTHS
jgi:pimeloyl-ACP methyl ester carboxylesterase